jgi:hypothetical protein
MHSMTQPSARAERSSSRPSSKSAAPRVRYTARTADRYELYQLAVQAPEDDLAFLEKAFRRWRKRTPLHFREDFCGTAFLCATWVAKDELRTAEGYDLDAAPLAWGRQHNLSEIGDAAARVTLNRRDVRAKGRRPADLRVAQNFSYMVFKERAQLLEYFRAAQKDLAADGVFALDHYGGLEATEETSETRRCPGFTYVWDQARYLPGTGDYLCHIGFKFRDGTEMKRAFSYDWRYWHLTEVKDLLLEAGFRAVHLYFEQSDDDDYGNGEFVLDPEGRTSRNCAGIVTYLIALK